MFGDAKRLGLLFIGVTPVTLAIVPNCQLVNSGDELIA